MSKIKKGNIIDYLRWRGDISFSQDGLCEIDSLILSVFSYINFFFIGTDVLSIHDAALKIKQYASLDVVSIPFIATDIIEAFEIAGKCKRYQDILITHPKEEMCEAMEMQFCAVTFLLPDETAFISFRGTDNSLVGWKEDLNMCFLEPIPAQLIAREYTMDVMTAFSMRRFILGGHSKGGNLAVWAAVKLPENLRQKVIGVYNNDGPGFNDNFWKNVHDNSMSLKIKTFIPYSSIVGVLMEQDSYVTIESDTASLLQHNPFSWLLVGRSFCVETKRSISSRQIERVVNSWIKAMTPAERENFIEYAYEIISSTDVKNLTDLVKNMNLKTLFKVSKTIKDMGIKKHMQLGSSLLKLAVNEDSFTNYNIFNLISDENVNEEREDI